MKKILLSAICLFAFNVNAQTYFSDDFNDGNLNGWTLVDADGDTRNWVAANLNYSNGYATGVMRSASWQQGAPNNGVLTPNNWAISSAIDLTNATGTTSLKWKISAIDAAWDAENYTVYVGTTNTVAALQNSTTTFSETTLNGVNFLTDRSLDVSAFNGQTIYVAFRHYNVSDQFTIEVDDVQVVKVNPDDAEFVSLTNLVGTYALNSNVSFQGVVRNNGNNNITSLGIQWSVGNGNNSQTFSGLNIAPGQTYNFTHGTPWTATQPGEFDLDFEITSVNGNTDPNIENNQFSTNLLVINEIYTKKVVYEEGTGTWCQFCPRGLVGLKDMSHLYPDTFIGIGVHNADPMANQEYDAALANFISGYPSGLLNRNTTEVDPGLGSLQPAYLEEVARIPSAKIEVVFQSWNGDTREVNFIASTTFALDMNNANYNVGAVIVENGVTGTSNGYNQVNWYSGNANVLIDHEGVNWNNLPNPVPAASMVYDHVGRTLLGGWEGISGEIPSNVNYATPYNTVFSYTLPASYDENEIELVVFLIDNATGQIVNANKVDMGLVFLSNDDFTAKSVKLYPNPTNGMVNIDLNENADLMLIDMVGKVIMNKNLTSGNNTIQLDTLPKGVYFAKIKGLNIDTVEKIIVQ